MENGLKVVILSLAMAITGYLNAVIPEIEIWTDKDNKHFLYLLKDIHLDYKGGDATIKQHHDILWILQQKVSDIFIITEDIVTPMIPENSLDGQNPLALFDNCIYQMGANLPTNHLNLLDISPLLLLMNTCKKANIMSYNAECFEKAALYENCKDISPEEQTSYHNEIIESFSAYLSDLQSSQTPVIDYDTIENELTTLKNMVHQEKIPFLIQTNKVRYLILEARTLYQLEACKKIKHGVICQGASHIERIKSQLSMLGYKHIQTIGLPIHEACTLDDAIQGKHSLKTPVEELIQNPLDLHKIFTEIFNEQKPLWQKAVTYLAGLWMKIR